MTLRALKKIDLSRLGDLHPYVGQWIAISTRNEIVSHGRTHSEMLRGLTDSDDVILFKVPPLDASLVVVSCRERARLLI